MKKKIFSLLLAAIAMTGAAVQSDAQVNVSINIGRQPAWGPSGYDYVDNYYLPEYDAYYSVGDALFYFFNGGQWVSGSCLPQHYGNVNLYNTYKVVVNDRQPWRYADRYRQQYGRYRGYRSQPVIRDYRGDRYYAHSGRNRQGWDNGSLRNRGWNGGYSNGGWNGRRDNQNANNNNANNNDHRGDDRRQAPSRQENAPRSRGGRR